MTRSSSKAEDERREKESPSGLTRKHGGELVESIAPEELESFNDADCKHTTRVIDASETEFLAYACANPDCNEIFLYDKPK